jgi:hypothetical protein
MANFHTVPVIDVHNENFKQLWPTMVLAVKSATYVALDLVSNIKAVISKLQMKFCGYFHSFQFLGITYEIKYGLCIKTKLTGTGFIRVNCTSGGQSR